MKTLYKKLLKKRFEMRAKGDRYQAGVIDSLLLRLEYITKADSITKKGF